MAGVDIEEIAKQNAEILEEVKALRREIEELRAAASHLLDFQRRNDPRRISNPLRR
ncbi:hypothetical protein [Rhizobium sp. BK251]|uniref:hypothetical protein n=1 Tax=Rhizobium sp. BK251 TaxID=2512125 RepID=UPI0010E2E7B5|nr:hypothetical protein [Rhizobium sp. BK251]TCL67226.1 hypothetical protein EV286_110128 [Rhizobium sp. BK251]